MNRATFERIPDQIVSSEARRKGVGLYNESTGMEYVVFDTPFFRYVEACHEDVGQVEWFTSDNTLEEIEATLMEDSER